jgi:hypothetical protein
MVFSHLVISLSIFILTCFTNASLNSNSIEYLEAESTDDWNPKNDAIYDPETGLCYFEDFASHHFRSISLEIMKEARKAFLNNENKTKNETTSFRNAQQNSPEFLSVSSPSSQSSSSSASYSPIKISNLYVPDKCKAFERKWDFYLGYPEYVSEIIGWISRIGFADDVIRELELPTYNASYTLLPYGYSSKAKLSNKLYKSRYMEFNCFGIRLFQRLFSISFNVDAHLRRFILAINISFDKYSNVCVKIIFDGEIDDNDMTLIYWQLVQSNPLISYYRNY